MARITIPRAFVVVGTPTKMYFDNQVIIFVSNKPFMSIVRMSGWVAFLGLIFIMYTFTLEKPAFISSKGLPGD